MGLTVLLPVTRAWSRQEVMASVAASDIPRENVLLVIDAPGVGPWPEDFEALGFIVTTHRTGAPVPPDSHRLGADPTRLARMERHRAVRRLTQELVPDGPLLCIEDDGILPHNVYSLLAATGTNATGVQVGRHEIREPGIQGWHQGQGTTAVEACGHYCLLTTGAAYKAAPIPDKGEVDLGHTAGIRPLVVVEECLVGHLTEQEGVLWP